MTTALQRLDQLHKPDTFDDTLNAAAVAGIESSAVDFADFQEGYLSQLKRIIHGSDSGDWHGDPATLFTRSATLKELASKTPLDEKLDIRWRINLTDLTAVPASAQHILLDTAGEPPSAVIAYGATAKGAVCAQLAGAVGTASLDEVTGSNALKPKNLVSIFDGANGDAITSSDRRVYGLLQVGTAATDGNAFGTAGNDLGQISFVRPNATYDDLEFVPAGDMDGLLIIYAYSHRTDMDSRSEDEFRGDLAKADPAAGAVVTLDAAYDGGNFIEADGSDVDFRLADTVSFIVKKSGGADLFKVIRTDAGTADNVIIGSIVDNFDCDAAVNDFLQGISVDTGGTTINLGVTAGQVDATALALLATTGNLTLSAASGEVNLVTTRQASLPLDDATAGGIGALDGGPHASVSAAIKHAIESGGVDLTLKVFTAGSNYAQDANIPAATLDLSAFSLDMNTPAGVDLLLFLNGKLLVGGNVGTQNDVYVGTTPASGDIKVDFAKGIKTGDVIISVGLQQ